MFTRKLTPSIHGLAEPFAYFHIFFLIHNNSWKLELAYHKKSVFMRKIIFAALILGLILVINACSKSSSSSSNARTVQNLSGSYMITALSASLSGLTINLFDSLPPCEQDNIIQLNTDGSAKFIDAGTKCVPPSDSSGTWSLSQNTDTIYIAGSASFIKSWDGTTLVVNNSEMVSGFPVTATTTLKKQ
jgi:hypothetical protein